MAFELVIAAKRDPAEGTATREAAALPPANAPLPAAIVDVGGDFTADGAAQLERRVADLLDSAGTVIIRFASLACGGSESLVHFSRWVESLRADGYDVRVAAGEPAVAELLAQADVPRDALIDAAEADAVARRSTLDVHR
ncbi:MAG: hypothetical protein M3R53_00295 [Candidatus Eremiobacteraeota bacterium]|nr:hypothetical protein [Candidatus Eremiobacteraeota bacterium]